LCSLQRSTLYSCYPTCERLLCPDAAIVATPGASLISSCDILVCTLFASHHDQFAKEVSTPTYKVRCLLRIPQPVSSFPQELIDRVIDWACVPATTEEDSNATARACSLVKFSWSRRSRQKLFRRVTLNPELLVRWCKNIPDSAAGPSSFVRVLSLERITADHLIQHIEHLKAFKQVTILYLGFFDDGTFNKEKIERCFSHFGPTVQFLMFFTPQCRASLFPHLLGLFTRAIRIDINIPIIDPDVDETEYKPLPNLEVLRLGLEQGALIDYELLEACTNLRAAFISCPRSTARFWFNHLFIRCADTLESVLIGPEYKGELEFSPLIRERLSH